MTGVLNHDCVACLARSRPDMAADEQVITILVMQKLGMPLEHVVRDLCWSHRRVLHGAVRDAERAAKGGA